MIALPHHCIASMPTGTTNSHSKYLPSTGVTAGRWARIFPDEPSVPILDLLRLCAVLSDMMRLFATRTVVRHWITKLFVAILATAYFCTDKPPGTPNETRNG